MLTVLMIIISTIIMSARTVLIMVPRHNDLLVWRQNQRGKRSARKGGVLAPVTLRALPLPKNPFAPLRPEDRAGTAENLEQSECQGKYSDAMSRMLQRSGNCSFAR
jgi:hypothetical protein